MEYLAGSLSGILLLAIMFYILYLQPKQEERQARLIFDNRVLGFIDGLYASGMKFGCADFEMRAYARRLLEKAHALPSNQLLLEHTCPNGFTFRSHIGLHGDHICFALLCIIDRADPEYDADLISQCEAMLIPGSKIRY